MKKYTSQKIIWLIEDLSHPIIPGPVFSYKLRYIVGFWLVEMTISTNQKPTIYRNLYGNTAPEEFVFGEMQNDWRYVRQVTWTNKVVFVRGFPSVPTPSLSFRRHQNSSRKLSKHDFDPKLFQCWDSVVGGGPTVKHLINVTHRYIYYCNHGNWKNIYSLLNTRQDWLPNALSGRPGHIDQARIQRGGGGGRRFSLWGRECFSSIVPPKYVVLTRSWVKWYELNNIVN